ncbi:MAG TPA: adenylate/guanylate cyclase domain-containing protein [Nevskiaceae bacterium]|nr:adenylate/guanylate cyclase domain-containing protein [Nevskiaceae bacterium]
MRELVILFADLTGSTSLYEKLGDAAAKDAVQGCLQRLSALIAGQRGRVIKSLGDGVLAAFARADDAAALACRVQQESQQHQGPCAGFSFRIGFHLGAVIDDGGDIFGDAVNTSSRLTTSARPGQILTTQATVLKLSPGWAVKTRAFDFEKLKGKAQPVAMFELIWENTGDVTDLQSRLHKAGMGSSARSYSVLLLHAGGRSVSFTPTSPPLTIGRSAMCGLVVPASHASREHARCEYSRGKFVFTDQSANGSYVLADGQHEVFLRRESIPLTGRGLIGLGAPLPRGDAAGAHNHIIRFESQ